VVVVIIKLVKRYSIKSLVFVTFTEEEHNPINEKLGVVSYYNKQKKNA
jgi:hypothetical protein